MRTTIRHGGKISCEIGTCERSFVTYSLVSMARIQAKDAGWGRVRLNMLFNWQKLELGSDGRKKLDACPPCYEFVQTEHARRIEETKKQTAADRAANKAAKAADEKAKRDERMAKRAVKREAKRLRSEAWAAKRAARAA